MKSIILFLSFLFISVAFASAEKVRGAFIVIGDIPAAHSLDTVLFEEFMNFGCPHCNHFHTLSQELRAKYKGRVNFVDMPILFQGQNDAPIRLYYVAETVGKHHEVKEALLKAKFTNGVDTFDPGIVNYLARTLGLGDLYRAEGPKDWVTQKIKAVEEKAKRFGISSTPTIVLAETLVMSPRKSMEEFVKEFNATLDDLLKAR